MAKTTAGFYSQNTSGQFDKFLVHDKRGFIRAYVVPSNPNTVAQQNVRRRFSDGAKSLVAIGPDTTDAIRESTVLTVPGYRWKAWLIGKYCKDIADAETAYDAFNPSNQADWDTAATGLGINPTTTTSAGFLLYRLALVLSTFLESIPAPTETNSAAVSTAIES